MGALLGAVLLLLVGSEQLVAGESLAYAVISVLRQTYVFSL
jgi:hypothetical protein